MRFTIECDGISLKEGQEIIEHLLSIRELDDLDMRFDIDASAASQVAMYIPHFEIWASVAGVALGGAVVKAGEKVADAALTKIGEQIATRLSAWLRSRAHGKSAVEMGVTLYGPDGKLIENLKGKR
ncbi:MAG: hypothetical protein ABR898_11370 [Terracidiphilus sp.]|jgi:hypothetical protein